jgi:hypothetical protein
LLQGLQLLEPAQGAQGSRVGRGGWVCPKGVSQAACWAALAIAYGVSEGCPDLLYIYPVAIWCAPAVLLQGLGAALVRCTPSLSAPLGVNPLVAPSDQPTHCTARLQHPKWPDDTEKVVVAAPRRERQARAEPQHTRHTTVTMPRLSTP